jgi:hypothetical protein
VLVLLAEILYLIDRSKHPIKVWSESVPCLRRLFELPERDGERLHITSSARAQCGDVSEQKASVTYAAPQYGPTWWSRDADLPSGIRDMKVYC